MPRQPVVFRKLVCAVAALAFSLVLSAPGRAADPNAPAIFQVGTSAINPGAPRFGLNIIEPRVNNWTKDAGMEPIILRYKSFATGGGADFILNESGPKTDVWETITDGFFDGATVRVYRIINQTITHVRTDSVVSYKASVANGFRIDLASSGPVVQSGDIYFIERYPDEAPMASVHPRVSFLNNQDTWLAEPVGTATSIRDSSTVAPVDGGRTSRKLTMANAGFAWLRQWGWLSPEDGHDSPEPGSPMRLSVWLKQEGVASGSATFEVRNWGSPVGVVMNCTGITDQWQQFTMDFPAPAYSAAGAPTTAFRIMFLGPGTLWVDNALLYDTRYPPFALDPRFVQAAIDSKPGDIRIWSGHSTPRFEWGRTLEDWTNSPPISNIHWGTNQGRIADVRFHLPEALELCRQTGANPWLIIHATMSEQEWSDLIDYLAGPDTTAYGAKRAAQGQVEPWTTVFGKIRLELNNEAWNQGFAPWNDPSGQIHGAWADYFYGFARSNPHFNEADFELSLNGWAIQPNTNGFGQQARYNSVWGTSVGVTSYMFGWLLSPPNNTGSFTESGVENTLLYLPAFYKTLIDDHATTRALMASQGFPYTIQIYEAGSGYRVPTAGQPFHPAHEQYGKCLAAGVANLDMHLYHTLRGTGSQCFFVHAGGVNWTSHSSFATNFRAHAPFLALQMRNRFATGDMAPVSTLGAPTVDIPAHIGNGATRPPFENQALLSSYAFRDADSYSVFVLSRRLNEATPTTLRLPFSSVSSATLHKLTGDPRQTNIEADHIVLESEAVTDFAQEYSFVMPPGSVYLYRFEGATPTPPTQPTPTITRMPGQADQFGWPAEARFKVAFDLPITGFQPWDVALSGSAGAQYVVITEVEPLAGTDFMVSVSGMTGPGEVTINMQAGAVEGPGGAPSLAPTIVDNSVEFVPVPEANTLYVYDDLNLAPSGAPFPPFLQDVNTGVGFTAGWKVQNFNGATYTQGYELSTQTPLGFRHLKTTGSYAIGSLALTGAQRALDIADELAAFRIPSSNPGIAGRVGTSLWMSALLRKDADDDAEVFLTLSDLSTAYGSAGSKVSVGYFGAASNVNGERRWSLRVTNTFGTGFNVFPTSTPVVVGESALFVVRLGFDLQDSVRMYVNPASLGIAAPATPSAEALTELGGTSVQFRTLAFQGGATYIGGSVDEIRFGGSYKAVTPTRECPGDTNGDGGVDFADLNAVLSSFGQSGQPDPIPGDVNKDGVVNFLDLNIVLSAFGAVC